MNHETHIQARDVQQEPVLATSPLCSAQRETKKAKPKSKWESEDDSDADDTQRRKKLKKASGAKREKLIDTASSGAPSETGTPGKRQREPVDAQSTHSDMGEPSPKRRQTESSGPASIDASLRRSPHGPSPSYDPRNVEPTTTTDMNSLAAMSDERPAWRSESPIPLSSHQAPPTHTALSGPPLVSCRNVDNYEKLNRIEEGAYGVVYRARDRQTGEIVALKKLKLENEKNGFPVTSLREIHTLLLAKHPNIVNVKEIVVTPSMSG